MSNAPPKPPAPKLPPLSIDPDLKVEYVNLVRIAHSPAEIVFDFAQMLPGSGKAEVQSRIIMSPIAAKLFLRAMTDNLAKYESAFGEIKIPGGTTLADALFRSPEKPPQE